MTVKIKQKLKILNNYIRTSFHGQKDKKYRGVENRESQI